MKRVTDRKNTGYILSVIAVILGIIALICYLASGEDKSGMTETVLFAGVYVPMIIAILIGVLGLFFRDSIIKTAAFAAYFLAIAMWAFSQAGYIVNVFMGIDGNAFSFAYVLSFIAMIAAPVLSLVSLKKFKK